MRELIGGPWAIRYSLSHLVKDEATLPDDDWRRTWRILPHGSLVAGFMTGNFDVTSVSSAASTGMLDLRTATWQPAMLEALADPAHRKMALEALPRVVDHLDPVGPLSPGVCHDLGIDPSRAPLVFPTSDDQQAGLAGGGAVDDAVPDRESRARFDWRGGGRGAVRRVNAGIGWPLPSERGDPRRCSVGRSGSDPTQCGWPGQPGSDDGDSAINIF